MVRVRLAQGKNAEAEELLADMLKANPEGQPLRPFILRLRTSFYARCRRWNEAITDLRQAVKLDALHDDSAFQLGVLLLETGDRENYRAHCRTMATAFRAANLPGPLGKTAKVCLLVPEAASDFEAACQMADEAFKLGQNSYWRSDVHFIKGLAEYRAGHFASAIDWVGKSIGQPTMVGGPRPDAAAYSVLAMAQHQLKHPEEAHAALAKSAEIVNAKLLKLENTTLDENWVDWLIAHTLLREAQALIEVPPAQPKQ
jgi:tetratricopeptide (TPR) repeat protein